MTASCCATSPRRWGWATSGRCLAAPSSTANRRRQRSCASSTEETGYTGELEGLVGVIDRLFHDDGAGGRLHAIRILYRVRIVGGELRDEPDGSTDTCRWFAPSEARGLRLGELARYALDHLRADPAS